MLIKLTYKNCIYEIKNPASKMKSKANKINQPKEVNRNNNNKNLKNSKKEASRFSILALQGGQMYKYLYNIF